MGPSAKRVAQMFQFSGRGLELPDLYQIIYGSSPSAKAFRSLMTKMKGEWYRTPAEYPPEVVALAQAAFPTYQAMRTSQALKTLLRDYESVRMNFSDSDLVKFATLYGRYLPDLKKILNLELTGKVPTLSGESKRFLREWIDTNSRAMPRPNPDIVEELRPYRPDGTLLLYRGIRFNDVGELVEFTKKFAETGKVFPFESNHWTSWTTSREVAERFGRYTSATSQNEAMMGWLSMVKSEKSYSGSGGYVIGARVQPDQCLVDIGKTGISGQHGNESEVIVNRGAKLVCKVYEVFGDVAREVQDFRNDKYRSRDIKDFIYSGLYTTLVSVEGDLVTFKNWKDAPAGSTPRSLDLKEGGRILNQFRSNLYQAQWINDFQVRFSPMDI
jgi:hypothetical protein